ncbi:hypothetical protein ElyMa_003121600 [Elysia marginata]|uniref:Endonuclease/exonuclease/phosphatase domain-containing protein n=1 Tax=Elysia marginata TaxID=1093978 RepID=A0AAV4IR86_9GAST|nr:hypothetical protein ElyMa_003121600 [Elysia marginata]
MILIQENNFVKETPFQLNGFCPIRTERKTARNADGNLIGGGILTLIKSGVQHNVPNFNILPDNDHTSESHVIDLYLENSIIRATKIYVPPIKESDPNDHRIQNFKSTLLPSGKNCLILGDLNVHSPIWDQCQPRNSIGELIEDFVVDKDLITLDEGSATFISPATGGSSAPDISICGADIAPKITWTIYPATLGSDHHPILMNIEVPGPKEIDTAVKERTALKSRANHSGEDRKAWLEKCSAVKKLITDSNRQSWRDFATKLNARSDSSKVWNTIRAIDGRGKRAPEGAAMEVNGQLIISSQKKADQFVKMYKEVSEVRHQKLSLADSVELNENINRDRQYVRIVRRVANSECSCPLDGYCAPFNKKELDASLAQLKNTSPGDDQIHNKLLTHLPPAARWPSQLSSTEFTKASNTQQLGGKGP